MARMLAKAKTSTINRNGSEEAQRSFDATCRKLHRFLTQPQR